MRLVVLVATTLVVSCGGAKSIAPAHDGGAHDAGAPDRRVDAPDTGVDVLDARAEADAGTDAAAYALPGPCIDGMECAAQGPGGATNAFDCACQQGAWSCVGARPDTLPPTGYPPELPSSHLLGACHGWNYECVTPDRPHALCFCNGGWACFEPGATDAGTAPVKCPPSLYIPNEQVSADGGAVSGLGSCQPGQRCFTLSCLVGVCDCQSDGRWTCSAEDDTCVF